MHSRELDDALAVARSGGAPKDGLSSDELTSLRNNVAYQIARVSLFRAASYPLESVDRTAALQQAVKSLHEVRIALADGDPLMWDVLADLLSCHRRLQQWTEATQVWRMSDPQRAAARDTARLRAEAMRLLIDQGQPQQALTLRGATDDDQANPELDLALLETLLALWRKAEADQRPGEATRLKQRVEQTTAWMEQRFGPLWRRRADSLLLRAAPESAAADQWRIVQRQAADLARQNRVNEAIDVLDQALRTAPPTDANAALALAYQAATMTRLEGRNGEFLERLRDLTLKYRAAEKAPEAHAQAIAVSVVLAKADPAMAAMYSELIDEHLTVFPESESSNQVRLWKSRQAAFEGRADEALQLLLQVQSQSPVAVEAAREAGLLQLSQLSAMQEAEGEKVASNKDRAEQLTTLAAPLAEAANQARARDHQDAARAWTAWWILLRLAGGEERTGALQQQLNSTAAADALPDEQLAQAALACLAGKSNEALGALSNFEDLRLLNAMSDVLAMSARNGDAARKRLAADMLLIMLQLPQYQNASGAERTRKEALRGQALLWAGRQKEALQFFSQLAKERPKDVATQMAFGNLLLNSSDEQNRRLALDHWRVLAARTQPRSEPWYRAKYGVAKASFLLGDKTEAAKLIRYVQATTGWKDCPNQADFERLLVESERVESRG